MSSDMMGVVGASERLERRRGQLCEIDVMRVSDAITATNKKSESSHRFQLHRHLAVASFRLRLSVSLRACILAILSISSNTTQTGRDSASRSRSRCLARSNACTLVREQVRDISVAQNSGVQVDAQTAMRAPAVPSASGQPLINRFADFSCIFTAFISSSFVRLRPKTAHHL